MKRAIAMASALMLALALGACGDSEGASGDTGAAGEAQEQERVQAFETDEAYVEYQGTQDAAGNAVVTFALTNNTDRTVMVAGEGVVVNDQFDVQALGGSTVPIEPGHTGAVSLTFGVSVQTTLGGTEDMETLSADLVLMDDETYDRIAVVPVSVTI